MCLGGTLFLGLREGGEPKPKNTKKKNDGQHKAREKKCTFAKREENKKKEIRKKGKAGSYKRGEEEIKGYR